MVLEPEVLFAWLMGDGGFLLVLVCVFGFLLWECSPDVWGLAAAGRRFSAFVWGSVWPLLLAVFLLSACSGFSS
jgi:hypothetical protein